LSRFVKNAFETGTVIADAVDPGMPLLRLQYDKMHDPSR
jgi:hypothetical protein